MISPTNIDNEGITPSNCKIKKLAIYHKSQIQMYIYDKGTVLTIVCIFMIKELYLQLYVYL
jgi:hypothetical protein